MKKLQLFLFAISFCLVRTQAQVSLTATQGTGTGSFTTLKGAFDAINAGTHQGDIVISLTGNTTEAAVASLNASGSGSANYTSVSISPSGGAARTITGNLTGVGMIKLNGADHVTIDGLNSGGNTLTIENQSQTGGTILFTNDASSNTITNCNVNGNNTSSFVEYSGTISFGNAAASGTGNDNNTISYCNIGPGYYSAYYIGVWGYNTTASTFNNNNTISHCNIYNFYISAAGQISSSGVYTYTGNSDWTITANNFYQTVARNTANNSVFNSIYLRSSTGTGFTITNNYIGGSAADHSGTWSCTNSSTSSSWNAFTGMVLEVGNAAASSVQGNTIAGISYSTGGYDNVYGSFMGIYVASGGKVNIGNVTGNIIGSDAGNSITVSGGSTYTAAYGISYMGEGGISISNNKIGGFTTSASSSGTLGMLYMSASAAGDVTVNNNLIGSTTQSNSVYQSVSGCTMTIYGAMISVLAGTLTVSGNTVSSLTNASSTTGGLYGMYIAGGTVQNISSNSVYNLRYNFNNSSQALNPLTGMQIGANNATINVSGNQVHTLKLVNGASSYAYIYGMTLNGTGSTFTVENNLIHSLSTPNLGGLNFMIQGISLSYGKTTFRNNMIRLGYDETGTNINATPTIDGVFSWSGSDSIFFYNNTVYLGGSYNGTATRSQICFREGLYRPLVMKNNIFVNTRALTTPSSYTSSCVDLPTTTVCDGPNGVSLINPGVVLDNNLYYFSGNGTALYWGITTLAAWQNYTRQEYNSLVADPKLKNPTGTTATLDLHIDPAQSSPAEGTGVVLSDVTTDYDGDLRASYTPADMGADCGNFTPYDVNAPGITYGVMTYKGTTGDRTLSGVRFFDPNGIATGALAPRIYYKKNAGSWFSNAGALQSSTSTSAVYDLTILAADMGGLASGDIVYYYVVAQENTGGYLSSKPAGVTGTSVTSITTAPSTLYSYAASITIAGGTYQVGASQSAPYNNLYNAITAYSAAIVTGPVILELIDDSYTFGSTTAVLNYNSDMSATNTLTIRPASGKTPVVTGTVNGAMIQLKGADYVTIDGSNNGSTTQDLTFINNTSGGSLIQLANGSTCGGAGATYNTVKNLILKGGNTTTGYGIVAGSTSAGAAGDDHDYNSFTNNLIQKVGYGIFIYSSTSGYSDNNTISGNVIGSSTATDYVGYKGIYLYAVTATTLSGNRIYDIISSSNTDPVGIDVSTSCSTVIVDKNMVYAVNTTMGGYGAKGIRVISNGNTVRTNLVFDIGGTGSTTAANYIAGIYNTGTTNLFYYNTVYMSGDYNGNSTSVNIASAFYNSASTGVDVRNNIFYNQIDPVTGSNSAAKSYAIYLGATPAVINYNDYYAAGQNPVLGFLTSDQATIAAWRTATAQEANSYNADPGFALPGGTAAANYLPSAVALSAFTISGITTDYSGNPRGASVSSMGILEYTVNTPVTVTASAGTATANYINLKAAFDAINAGTHQGAISVVINQSVTEYAAAALYQSGYGGTSSYTAVQIYPSVTGLTVGGSLATPLIDFNGAANVILDGRVNATGSTRDLIIINTSTSSTAGTSTIRFINDAATDTVRYCSIKGSTTDATGGIILFSTTTATNGNDGNVIDNNNITNAADASRPLAAIYSVGTALKENSGNVISNNSVYDFFSRGTNSYGLFLSSNTTGWTISGNSFFETASFVPSSAVSYYVVFVSNTSGTAFSITGNFIGGSSANCGSGGSVSAWTKTSGSSNNFYGIYLNAGTAVASSIQGNTIQNFNYANAAGYSWYGISIAGGAVNLGTVSGNTIGAATGTGSVTFNGNAGNASWFGISLAGSGTISCQNNTVGSVSISNSAANATTTYGIYSTATGTVTVNSNTIGSATTANSLNVTSASTGTAQSVYGIYNSGNSVLTMSGNTIANITNGTTNTTVGTTGVVRGIYTTSGTNVISNNVIHDLTIANANTNTSFNMSAAGICFYYTSASTAQTISGNTIYNITNSYATYAGVVAGLYYSGGTTASTVSGNYIYGISATGASSTTAAVYGIDIASGTTTYANNIITIGTNAVSTWYGIYETGASSNNNSLYFNTVYIAGAPVSGALNSYALYSAVTTNTRNFRNNIFMNARSNNGATGIHYAAFFNYAVSTSLTLNYNDYYVNGTGGVLGRYNSADVSSVPLISGQDAFSVSANPSFSNAGGTNASDYLPSAITLNGVSGTGITTDYTAATRVYNAMGAYDYAVNWVVRVTATGGITAANYNTVKGVFDAINAGTHTGTITVMLYSGTTETASAVLNGSGSGSASYTSVNMYPVNSGLTITGTLTTPLIDLYGADNVTIDGRVNAAGTTRDLIIVNTSASSLAGTSTIRMYYDAQNNTVKYCYIKGSTTDASGGMIFISTAGTGTGNTGIVIDHCDITKNGASMPKYALWSAGTSAKENVATVSNCNFYDFSDMGIWVTGNSKNWVISGNSFYQTATVTSTSSQECIRVQGGDGWEIYGNYLGGSAASCGGTAWTTSSAGAYIFYGIDAMGVTLPASKIYSNVIRNFNITSVGSSAPFTGIYTYNGNMNIGTDGANIIGDSTGTGNIVLNGNYSGGAGTSYGIIIAGATTGTKEIRNNIIGSIDAANSFTTSGSGHKLYAISVAGSGNITVSSNKIGSLGTANSLNATNNQSAGATANNQFVYGIYAANSGTLTVNSNVISGLNSNWQVTTASGYGFVKGIYTTSASSVTITGNTVANLSSQQAMTGTTSNTNVVGIQMSSTAATGNTVSGNTIYNLTNTQASYAGAIIGLYYQGATTGTNAVANNFIHSITVPGATSTAASVYGIYSASGATTYSNNLISLGGDTKTSLYGIYDAGGASNNTYLYFNTVHLSGNVASGATNKSYGLYSAVNTNTRNFRNNIFSNVRSTTSGASLHYAMYIVSTGGTITANYNDYYAPGTGGVRGYYGANAASLPIVTAQDANSLGIDPQFSVAGGTIIANYTAAASLPGVSGTGITLDINGVTRPATPSMGVIDLLTPLPLHLLQFSGYTENGKNHLNWKTTAERDMSHFTVERANDGIRFREIGTVQANNGMLNEYTFTDQHPESAGFYRLRMTDRDGSFRYSAVILLSKMSSDQPWQVFPNPGNGQYSIRTSRQLTNASLRVTDLSGRNMRSTGGLEGSSFSVDISEFPAGIYLLQIRDDQGSMIFRLIKK